MIFYYPAEIDRNKAAASALRPKKMYEAFASTAAQLRVVQGSLAERKATARRVLDSSDGDPDRFVYFENLTYPNNWSEGLRSAIADRDLDYRFLMKASKRDYRIGYFYRDFYWMFPELITTMGRIKKAAYIAESHAEFKRLESLVDVLFVASDAVVPFLEGYAFKRIVPLLPGCGAFVGDEGRTRVGTSLRLAYIGGLGGHYDLDRLLEVSRDDIDIKIAVRPDEIRDKAINGSSVSVHNVSGEQIDDYLRSADIGLLYFKPSPYMDMAMPYKLFDYAAHGLPILCSAGTAAARVVTDNRIGWSVEYSADALDAFLDHLKSHPEEIDIAVNNLKAFVQNNSWAERAKQAISVLRADRT